MMKWLQTSQAGSWHTALLRGEDYETVIQGLGQTRVAWQVKSQLVRYLAKSKVIHSQLCWVIWGKKSQSQAFYITIMIYIFFSYSIKKKKKIIQHRTACRISLFEVTLNRPPSYEKCIQKCFNIKCSNVNRSQIADIFVRQCIYQSK